MGCASSAASSNQGPDAEAGAREGHRPLKERRSPRTEEYYNAITGETTTVTKAPAPPPPGSRLVGGVSSVSSEGDLADRPGRRRDSKVRFGAGGGRRGSNPKSMKRAWSSFIGI